MEAQRGRHWFTWPSEADLVIRRPPGERIAVPVSWRKQDWLPAWSALPPWL
jgi:hypothetical protein